jgi:hypothetical protein
LCCCAWQGGCAMNYYASYTSAHASKIIIFCKHFLFQIIVLHLQYLNNYMSKETKKPKQPKTIRWGAMYDRIKEVCDKQERSISDYVRMAVSIQLDKDGV